ncbi:MAG: ATP12 family protein [Pseudomonadota bacterium]
MADILGERDDAIPDIKTRVAEPSRESQLPKRFYKVVAIAEVEEGFGVVLDERPVRTPGKALLASTSKDVADMLAGEWDAQGERIEPMTMPVTRLLNTAIDGVATEMQAVQEDIIRFAGTDLLCYRADGPDALVTRQMERWDPVLDWAQTALNARFELAAGVMHQPQPEATIAAFSTHVGMVNDPAVLAATHVMTTLTGSAIIAMAALKGELDLEMAWSIAHLDEDWNIEQWGEDEEAAARRAVRFRDMKAAYEVAQAVSNA